MPARFEQVLATHLVHRQRRRHDPAAGVWRYRATAVHPCRTPSSPPGAMQRDPDTIEIRLPANSARRFSLWPDPRHAASTPRDCSASRTALHPCPAILHAHGDDRRRSITATRPKSAACSHTTMRSITCMGRSYRLMARPRPTIRTSCIKLYAGGILDNGLRRTCSNQLLDIRSLLRHLRLMMKLACFSETSALTNARTP